MHYCESIGGGSGRGWHGRPQVFCMDCVSASVLGGDDQFVFTAEHPSIDGARFLAPVVGDAGIEI
jgi:hypothetical protein